MRRQEYSQFHYQGVSFITILLVLFNPIW